MVNTLSQNAKYALALANHGYKVLPCCWPDSGGKCACGWDHNAKIAGKAPRVRRGVTAASTKTAHIWEWWHETPEANVSIALEPNLIMLDPDSPKALAEVEGLGVPPTLTRISNNKAFIFAAPPGLPPARLVHCGDSQAIDVFSNGYCVVYGRHRAGCDINLEDPIVVPAAPPAWLIEWIAKYRSESPPPVEFSTDDPPVQLTANGLAWWRGERTVTGPGGDIDRSATIFQIALVLARANAGGAAIADALAERDETLRLGKYTERKDAFKRYAEIAQRVLTNRRTGTRNTLRPRHVTFEVRG